MNDLFNPPWNFFPLHTTRIEPFSVALEVGFDQGEQMCFSVAFYDESGVMTSSGPRGDSWREILPDYLEQISLAGWLAETEEVSGHPRYMRFNDENRSWEQEWRVDRAHHVPPACLMCGKRMVKLVDDICQDCYMEIFWDSLGVARES